MCGIFAYRGSKNAPELVLLGLKRLEYRGYDSWGIATISGQELQIKKQIGKIGDATTEGLAATNIAIGHTRWATTGGVTKANAHPHLSSDGSFALAQNGILENYQEIKQELLQRGYTFISETDTEVIVYLIEEERKRTNNLIEAICAAYKKMTGRNTIIVLTQTGEIYAVRNGSPLVAGFHTQTGELFLSSDTLSFAPFVDEIAVLENEQLVEIKNEQLHFYSLKNAQEVLYKREKLQIKSTMVDKEGYAHFMLKEIHESPAVIESVIQQPKEALFALATRIQSARRVYTIGSGTAGIAAAQIAYFLRRSTIDAQSLIGADAREYLHLMNETDILISPSQSGETADVLEILEIAKERKIPIASYVNMPGSAMSRMSDFAFMANAGPEVCVMSTKVFTSQIAWGYLLSKAVSQQYEDGLAQLSTLAQTIKEYLRDKKTTQKIKKLATLLSSKKDIFILGKGQNTAIINEGMVKLIEGSYKHAHSIPAGDLKHYAITLMEAGVPVIVVISNDDKKTEVIMAAEEIKARGAMVIAVATQSNEIFDMALMVPDMQDTQSIMNIIPLQLLAYELSVLLGNDVDKPRNIAKSVTVK